VRLKSSGTSLDDVLADGDEVIGKMKVVAVLEACPASGRCGRRRSWSGSRSPRRGACAGLGSKQREALVKEFSGP
jgi:hypothetical protein